VNYDNSLVVNITVTCYSWAPSSGDHLFTCGATSRPPHKLNVVITSDLNYWELLYQKRKTSTKRSYPLNVNEISIHDSRFN